jgi:5-formyltetrahydrofolate cyclo-ligase
VVCAYVPFGDEPGSLAMLDALRTAGARVLVPVIGPAGEPLRWAAYRGASSLSPGRFGIPTPTDAPEPTEAMTAAGMVLVPALAVDRTGVRLGRGAGHYDRTLPHAGSDARLVAVVRDDELVERLPAEPHDVRLGWALTPGHGLVRLGERRE